MITQSKKISAIQPYFFLNLQNKIDNLNRNGKEVIRLDIGSPDLPPPASVIDAFQSNIQKNDVHGYTSTKGPDVFRRAVASYYQKRFNVTLNPESEITPLLGSKEGIVNLHQIFIDPGDEILVPNPGYPSYEFAAMYAGGIPIPYDLDPQNGFQINLNRIMALITPRTKMLWINFPNNPTGSNIDLDTLQALVNLAIKHQFLIINDAPYTDVYFDTFMPPSILSVPNAREVAVEINSLSKTYHMAGWRIGMMCGHEDVIKSIRIIKSKVDNSTALPIFHAATTALNMDRTWLFERNQLMKNRRDIIVEYLKGISPYFAIPQAGYYLWAKIPSVFNSDFEFCEKALTQAGVSLTPGSIYGSNGKHFIRICICQPEETINIAVKRLKAWYS
ncbi:MAG: aminotransferase class I/II-fold pyridoxal phosphate-dependent enzyme [Anaerolineaceae bacterium]|nr:aminotransferase class I/II-fold pyridoxal phosphate-dependent enzyme [Anaerolineaceae bacterium]